jgi:hypothetical protein
LEVLQCAVLKAGWHEPYEPRGSRADLWGPAGEIPAGYPAKTFQKRSAGFRLGVRCRGVETLADGIETEGSGVSLGMGLAGARVPGRVVSGVEAA